MRSNLAGVLMVTARRSAKGKGYVEYGFDRIIKGDSMAPTFPDGTRVVFGHFLRAGERPVVGKYYHVETRAGAMFKRLVSAGAGLLVFQGINRRKFPRRYVLRRSEIVRMARVTGVWMAVRP
jgi:hypothetical protein